MDDINSTLEKIVKLDKDASKLDRDLLKHNSNFSEMHYNMGLAKPNPVSAKLLKKDVTLLSKKVKLLQRKLKKDDTNFAYQELFLRNAQYFLTARLAFNDFFYNPNSRIRPRGLLSILFENPYKIVLDTQNNPDRFYRLDHTRLRLSQKFSANLFSPNERETIKIEVPEHVSQKLKTKNNDKTRYLQIDPDNLMELYLATKLHIFWNAQDIIEHTNRMEEPLSRERIKTYAETHNFCLVRDVFYKNSRYSQRIFDEAPVVFGAPYYRKVVSKAVREYGIPLKLAEKVTSIGSWSTKTHYHFVELLLESMGYEKKVQDRTQKSI